MKFSSQRGSAIIMLFIAIALFGAVTYAFLQGSRTSTGMITGEADKAAGYKSQDCSNAVNMAAKRLQARGCGVMISAAADGSNANAGAPTDGSCSIYHANGGGVKGNCVPPPSATDACTTGPIGTACVNDGAFYIGDMGGNRIYAAAANEASPLQSKTAASNTAGTSSTTDGLANTAAMIAAGAAQHPAANSCNNKAPSGTWYVPAKDEFNLIWTNRLEIDLAAKGLIVGWYLTSTQNSAAFAWVQSSSNGSSIGNMKTLTYEVRCVRR